MEKNRNNETTANFLCISLTVPTLQMVQGALQFRQSIGLLFVQSLRSTSGWLVGFISCYLQEDETRRKKDDGQDWPALQSQRLKSWWPQQTTAAAAVDEKWEEDEEEEEEEEVEEMAITVEIISSSKKILERSTVRRPWSTHQSVVHLVHDPRSNPIRLDQIFNRISNRSKFPVSFLYLFLLFKNRAEFGSRHNKEHATPLTMRHQSDLILNKKGRRKRKKKRDIRKKEKTWKAKKRVI